MKKARSIHKTVQPMARPETRANNLGDCVPTTTASLILYRIEIKDGNSGLVTTSEQK